MFFYVILIMAQLVTLVKIELPYELCVLPTYVLINISI